MPVYQTTSEINAQASRVWQVLTGPERYAEWNPQIPTASGRLKVGGRIRLRLALPERPTLDLSATIEEVLPERLLTWRPCCETVVLPDLSPDPISAQSHLRARAAPAFMVF